MELELRYLLLMVSTAWKMFPELVSRGWNYQVPTKPHPQPYKEAWINNTSILVTKPCSVAISHGWYNDSSCCDVIPTTVTHKWLGHPWLYERDVHKCTFNNEQIVLKPMSAKKKKIISLFLTRSLEEKEIKVEFCLLLCPKKRAVHQLQHLKKHF